MEDTLEKVKGMVKDLIANSGLYMSDEQIDSAIKQALRGEDLKKMGFSDEMIELIQNIDNEEKQVKLMNKIIPSILEIEESPELQKAKLEMSNFGAICSKKYESDPDRGVRECSIEYEELQGKIKMLEMKHIRTEYGRLLNNYYMTLAQYLVQCREFETSGTVEKNFFGQEVNVPGLIPPNYDEQKKELESKMEEYYSNNCHGNWSAREWGCRDIIREKERLENALGINGLRKLWDDFVGEHTPKDIEGNPINPEELKEIYENIQLFAPLIMDIKIPLPEENGSVLALRKRLLSGLEKGWERGWRELQGRNGKTYYVSDETNTTQSEEPPRSKDVCDKTVRLSNLTMVIESRYELNKFIKSLGSFGKLLYLTLESGLFEFVEEALEMGQGGGGKNVRV
jgi:hypothetical protein